MDSDDEIKRLLRDIRDAQREQLAEHRRVTERLFELQQRALAQQEERIAYVDEKLVAEAAGDTP